MPYVSPITVFAALVVAGTSLPRLSVAQEAGRPAHNKESHMHVTTRLEIPESMRIEHGEIHAELERATKKSGKVGDAARELANVLHPHFVREEQIALPPLGLLAPLARGEVTPDMRDVLPMTDSLRAELPHMLEEHKAIRAATLRLAEAARAAHDEAVVELTTKLALHAQSEEEMFYPAAVLVGDLVRAKLAVTHAP